MKNQNIPLAIILKRTQNGYTFHSLQELQANKDKNKKPKPGRKPVPKGIPNRLIKQIGLSNDQIVPQITPSPEPQQPQITEEQQPQNPPVYLQPVEEEEISCQIDRDTELPKSPAKWFDKLKIHEIQRREMSQFFSGSQSKKPQLYLKYRNFIVEAYEKNPKRYLSKIACRRILRGDVNSIMRVHAFLQKHGIINFCLNYDGNYTFKPTSTSKFLEQSKKPQSVLKSLPDQDEETAQKQIDTDNMTLTVINKNFSRTYRACCSECRLICGIVWFANISEEQNTTQRNLCFQCWNKKTQWEKSEYSKVDIVKKMELYGRDGKNLPKSSWNIEENVKLLDFMSKSTGEINWRKLLDQFGGKRTIEDIILQFLQFPISNFEIKESKKQLQRQFTRSEDFQIGFNREDYKQILQQFYLNSQYSNKALSKLQADTEKTQQVSSNQEEKNNFMSIKNMLALTIENIMTKVQNLKAQEQLIKTRTATYESFVFYRKNKLKPTVDEEEVPKSGNEIESRAKSLKNLQSRKNQNSQVEQEMSGDCVSAQI